MKGIGAVASLACRANVFFLPTVKIMKGKDALVRMRVSTVPEQMRTPVHYLRNLQMFWIVALLIVASPLLAEGQQDRVGTASISGRVLDQRTNDPVAGVEVSVDGTPVLSITDESGEFHFEGVLAGTLVLRSRRLGYEERSDSLSVPQGVLIDLTIHLSTEPVELEELVVEVRSRLLEQRGFYERQRSGYGGVFIDREAIEDRNPNVLTDLFRTMSGLRVVYGGLFGPRVCVNQNITFSDGGLGCEPSLVLDGVRSTMRSYDFIDPIEVEGLEVYAGGGAPGGFSDPCGTIAIWTRIQVRRR